MLGVGILGAGFFGAAHARALRAVCGARLIAVSGVTLAEAAAVADDHGARAYDDWRRLLEDPSVDVVAIASPHNLHAEMAIAAAEADKHILLEKPMARSVEECTRIIEATNAAGVRLMIGHLLHFARPTLMAREILASGELGRPVTAASAYRKLWMEPNRRAWHLDPATGGGMLMTAGIHALDLQVWLMSGKVQAVSAVAGTYFHDQAADDTVAMNLRFADGRIGQVSSVGYRDGGVRYGLDLICEQGSLSIDYDRGVAVGQGERWRAIDGALEPEWMLRGLEREWQAMLAAIEGRAPVAVTGEYGRHIVGCMEAAFQSSRERREVDVPE